jgi:asparagine synthase (glutamine-hydrolysing)
MCGIFSLFNYLSSDPKQLLLIREIFNKGVGRGPDNTHFQSYDKNVHFGFHRLAINGLDEASNQPLHINDCILICNGEIYNYQTLYNDLNIDAKTDSDCEVIIHLYCQFGIHQTLDMLDGVFAFVLYDLNSEKVYVARDRFGVRPLFKGIGKDCGETDIYSYGSLLKTMAPANDHDVGLKFHSIQQFTPGTCEVLSYSSNDEIWSICDTFTYYSVHSIHSTKLLNDSLSEDNTDHTTYLNTIYTSLVDAVRKRVTTTERPIACLLSGGLDSSLITSIVHRFYSNESRTLETYSIGMPGSDDLLFAKKVADFLGTKHTQIEVSEEEFLNAIPRVVEEIESYDTTTVRASVGNYLVSNYISAHSDAKVIFNGDGSDEVCGGYMYFHAAPDSYSFDYECKRLLSDIHYFDVLRSDRSISSNGLEARTPFLDRTFVETYLRIPRDVRLNTTQTHCEKYLLRKAFDGKGYLPNEVLWRTKEAFSDGVSSQKKSWYQVIQEHLETHESNNRQNPGNETGVSYNWNTPKTVEQSYYRRVFSVEYTDMFSSVIPYFWMPKFVEATDASARTLSVYKKKMNVE